MTYLTITSPSFVFLILTSKSNSDKFLPSVRKTKFKYLSSSSIVPPFHTPIAVHPQEKKIYFSVENGKGLVFNLAQRKLLPNTVESLPHPSANCLELDRSGHFECSGSCCWGAGVRTVTKLLWCTNSLSQLQTGRSFSGRALSASTCLQVGLEGNMDRVSFAETFSAEFIWWYFRNCYE